MKARLPQQYWCCLYNIEYHVDHITLNTYQNRILDDGEGGYQHNDGEDKGADGIGNGPLRLKVDDQGGNENSDALEHVAHHMDKGCPYIQIGRRCTESRTPTRSHTIHNHP